MLVRQMSVWALKYDTMIIFMDCHRQAHSDFQDLLTLDNGCRSKDPGDATNHIGIWCIRDKWYKSWGRRCSASPKYKNAWGHSTVSVWVRVSVTQSCLTLCDPMDCNPPGSFVHGILQARIPEWVAIPISGGSSWPRDWARVSSIEGRFFTIWVTREVLLALKFHNLSGSFHHSIYHKV